MPSARPFALRRIRWPLAALLAAAVSACGSSGGSSSHAAAGHSLQTIFEAGPQLMSAPTTTLDKLKKLGVERVRLFVRWSSLAPASTSPSRPAGFRGADPAQYPAAAWAPYDAVVRAAAARGIGLNVTLGGPPPLWASGPGAPHPTMHPQWRPSASEFGAFVTAVAKRYSGSFAPPGGTALPRADFWSIWNEPNYGPDLAPQAIQHSTVEVSPLLYRRLLDAAWSALRGTGHGHDTILIGELAPRGITVGNAPGNFSGMVPLRFLRALYCVDAALHPYRGAAAAARGCPQTASAAEGFQARHPALFDASGLAVHPYPQGQLPPNVPTPGEPDYADLASLPHVEQTLDQLLRIYGSSRKLPLYDTEFGYQTDPPETIARAVDPKSAALYLNWSEYISWRDPRIRSYDQYLLTDPARANATGGFASGVEFSDGRRKATYAAFRMPIFMPVTSAARGRSLELWGCVRPAHVASAQTGAQQRAQIQFAPRASGAFTTLRTVTIGDPNGYFDVQQAFSQSGSVRLAWAYPHGPTVFSRTVILTLR